jgi:AraC family transcriptional regulator, chitin signaling transcriptional activator
MLSGKIIHQINKNKGLPNNTILSLHYSPKLWKIVAGNGLWGITVLDLQKNLYLLF